MYRVGRYVLTRKLRGEERYPLVLMLEPLFQCNLACAGCGKIDYPKEILQQRMSVSDALRAVDECGAPVVSIAGGEPLVHRELPQIVAGIVARKKFVYLCTNAILLAASGWQSRASRRVGVPGRRVRQGDRGDRAGPFPGLPRDGQLHSVQQRRSGRGGGVLRYRHAARDRGHHRVTRLQLQPRAASGCLPGAQREQVAVPGNLPPRPPTGYAPALVVQPFGAVSRFPGWQPDIPVHSLEQSHLQHLRLAAALLSALG